MGIFEASIREFAESEDIVKGLQGGENVLITGCIDACKEHLISELTKGYNKKLVVTYDEIRAREMCARLKFYGQKAVYYPAKDIIFYNADVHGNLIVKERMEALKVIMESEPAVIVTTIDGLCDRLMPLKTLKDATITLDMSSRIDIDELAAKLTYLGYERTAQVEICGQFAVRGSIIDIYSFAWDVPVRIDLWDDEIDSMKLFDAQSQRSIENIESFVIYPAREILIADFLEGTLRMQEDMKRLYDAFLSKKNVEAAGRIEKITRELVERIENGDSTVPYESIIEYFVDKVVNLPDYFGKRDLIVLDEPVRLQEKMNVVETEFVMSMSSRLEKGYILPKQSSAVAGEEEIFALLSKHTTLSLSVLESKTDVVPRKHQYMFETKNISYYNNSFELLSNDIRGYKKKGYKVVLVSQSNTRAKRLAADLTDNDVVAFYSPDDSKELLPGQVIVIPGNLTKGFEYPLIKLVIIAESDIFGRTERKKKRNKEYSGKRIADFNELSIGDYVVHEKHGIGIYRGIEKVDVEKNTKDYIKIEYANNSNLYILATQLDAIQKYADGDARKPKINKLNDVSWSRTKSRVQSAVNEVAKDLVELYATRQQIKGYQFQPDTPWQREFEEMFPFEETEDQLRAIADTKADMESTRVMDRLICGDVGFGKTEIAIRAAFKAVTEGKQVAYLVPTTILAQQHYKTFLQRMKDFAVIVKLMSRFATAKEIKETVEGLKKGTVDIVVGTHRILSKDVEFKNLGLLIIDEEQRFGVTHKEKIKKLKNDVDVLTLSATPIPRTLHMSLSGIRDMSVLEEAPVDRMPIQTFVTEYNEEMVKEAVHRELARNGQVYYVYNRVNTIEDVASKLQKLVPDANVAYAHGQMEERRLEQIMYDFINGDIDVLVSTTIIETGLDIPNVNTIIIHDAEKFGLSQLYQLRGRVGRSNRTSYAFLMYKKDKLLKEIAEKRLHAIREFTELGSGFKIAMKDLEIRGAGNVLGERQHGHMEAVGYDLYCKMLNEAVLNLKGIKGVTGFDTSIDVAVDAFIPSTYIRSEAQKLDIYKRIANIETQEEYEDMVDELNDRFGELPRSALMLLKASLIKALAHKAYITEISGNRRELKFKMYPEAKLETGKIPEFVSKYPRKVKLIADKVPYFTYILDKDEARDGESYLQCIRKFVEGIEGLKEE